MTAPLEPRLARLQRLPAHHSRCIPAVAVAHRAPGEIVASMAKLFVCFCSVQHIPGAPGTQSREWGAETVKRMGMYVQGLVSFTQENHRTALGLGRDPTRRIDLNFKQLVKDVPAAIGRIYASFYPDMPPPDEEAVAAFAAYLEENEREVKGNQPRSLADFDLTEDSVAFKEYVDLFLPFGTSEIDSVRNMPAPGAASRASL